MLRPLPVDSQTPPLAAAPCRSQDRGGNHPGRDSSSNVPGGRIAAGERSRVAGEASWCGLAVELLKLLIDFDWLAILQRPVNCSHP